MTQAEPQQDRGEFAKFSKFFTIRLVQAVVQSRLGQSFNTKSSPNSAANDWFNVKIEELGEVTNEIRSALGGRYPPDASEIALDFQLQTTEGEVLPLETWSVTFDSTMCDPKFGVRSHLYHQLSVLLRSAIAASRATPAYRYYSRKQSSESYIICYQLREGPPDLLSLGTGAKSVRLGYLPCCFGTLSLHLHYRTEMVISGVDTTPTFSTRVPTQAEPTTAGSPQEDCFSTFSTSPPSDAWLGNSPIRRRPSVTFQVGSDEMQQTLDSSSSGKGSIAQSSSSSEHGPQPADNSPASRNHSSQTLFRMEGSSEECFFRPSSLPSDQLLKRKLDFPFAALLMTASSAPAMAPQRLSSQSLSASVNTTEKPIVKSQSLELETREKVQIEEKTISPATVTPDNDEDSDDSFVKIDDIPPIFSGEPLGGDLSEFVRECKTAPPQLLSFAAAAAASVSDKEPSGSIECLPRELEQFQSLRNSFDDFIQSLSISQSEDGAED